ncbi:GEVED domain-containing protein [Paracrocinitomix mangrovi]|uniref:GEVED domain-containing protein n=1 Tax=Paracrocinitomix mangrovi TaxID=2862509 RepID=UPI001C8D7F22|nr:GEVED domain-containing protein [Paracrocinitomix mangrovi]UKN00437.1 GEVED domain-containing protein [Paracrocinitomix mangrovi]
MKNLRLLLLLVATVCIQISHAQKTHFDNKPYVEGEFLVQVKDGQNIRNIAKNAPVNYGVKIVEQLSAPMRVWLIEFDHSQVAHWEFQNWLYEQKEVSIADYNYYVDMRSTLPNDPSITSQWHHNNTGQTGGTVDADIDSDLAWDITTGGLTATNDDIVVCMVEGGGGNLDHQDLAPNRWINTNEIDGNGIDDDGNGYIDDYFGWNTGTNNDNTGTGGHGTNCLGMIGAKGNNGTNVAGANWDVKLMVLNMGGSLTQANVVSAYTYPLVMRQLWNNSGGTQGAFVVATSASWGIDNADPSNYPLWCNFYDTLGYYGVLNVGATTNSNIDVDVSGDMPTACSSPYMIGVGRTDHNDNTAGGYGDQTIEFGAPGINVLTTANTNTTGTVTGTSFACPLTAGVIGLAYSIPCTNLMSIVTSNPQGAADLVLQSLLNGTDPKSQLSTKFVTGGRLNSRNTLDELMALTCSGTLCLSPSSVSHTGITDNTVVINFTDFGSSDETVLYYQEAGTGSWTTVSNPTAPYTISGLTGCTDYEYYLISVCGTDTSSQTATGTFTTTGCGFCIDGAYCANSATDGVDEWIQDFSIDTYTNNSGNDQGYGDYTGASITLTKTMTYPITVTPGWSGTLYNEYSRIWIDYNQNGTFETGELAYDQGSATQTPATGNITVPGSATSGTTRMRVQLAYLGTGQSTLPSECGTFTWGEVEDYCVTIIDNNPCTMTISSTLTDPNCAGGNDGSIAISVDAGGSGPFSYSWSPGGQTSASVTGLSAGTYSVTVSQSGSCSGSDSTLTYTLTAPTALGTTSSSTNVSCNGGSDGAADVTVTGGTTPYTYSWDNGATTQDLSGVQAGVYVLTVTDANGCTDIHTVNITEPTVLATTLSTNDGDCQNDGDATVAATGGTSPYTYSWTSGGTAATETFSQTTSFTVTVTDANGCTSTENGTVTIVGSPTVSVSGSTNPSCNGGSDGSINVDVSGGSSPFTYSWSPSGATVEDATGLSAGTHTLTVTDAGGCTVTVSETLTEPTALSANGSSTDIINGNDGTVDITVSGGTAPYTYNWDNGATTEDLSGLSVAGPYVCTATDANGCTTTVTVTVNSQVGFDSYHLNDMVVYPNPTAGQVFINFAESSYVQINIYNSVGQLLMTTSNNAETSMEIDLNTFERGVYIINAIGENGYQINRRITLQ